MTRNRWYDLLFAMAAVAILITCGNPPAEEGKSEEPTASETETRAVPVEAMVVRQGKAQQIVSLMGVLRPNQQVEIVSEVTGKIQKILKHLGEQVQPGDTMAVVDDQIPLNQYKQAQAQLLSAENNLAIAELNLKSDMELFANGDISKIALENSKLAVKTAEANRRLALANLSLLKKGYRDTRIQSPIGGVVARKYIDVGTMVNPGTPVFRVVDLSLLKVDVGLSQSAVGHMRVGTPAEIRVSAFEGKKFSGVVRHLSPQADETTGAFTAEIHIPNTSSQLLKAGMTAQVDLTIRTTSDQIMIPDYALVSQNSKNYIYRIAKGRAILTEIDLGENLGSLIQVNSGIAEGDTIVIVGMKNLGTNSKVWLETVH